MSAGRISRYRQTVARNDPADLLYEETGQELALYLQDRLTLGSDLTLTGGLRWEGQWNPDSPHPNPRFPETAVIPDDLAMWQPRLGLTWDARGNGRTIVRTSAASTPRARHRAFPSRGHQQRADHDRDRQPVRSVDPAAAAVPGCAAGAAAGRGYRLPAADPGLRCGLPEPAHRAGVDLPRPPDRRPHRSECRLHASPRRRTCSGASITTCSRRRRTSSACRSILRHGPTRRLPGSRSTNRRRARSTTR